MTPIEKWVKDTQKQEGIKVGSKYIKKLFDLTNNHALQVIISIGTNFLECILVVCIKSSKILIFLSSNFASKKIT